ncbi:uncharacterized protein LOC110943894 [Helianthus annuus]|uniref:uncharacterized protein LOC110943894 n=1 Tax=Helianthus annuus TaxID=4232 RepID=UPI000B8FC970|nr:uncharacterized protein LOC110943894 [Helianthus annuus]
MTIPDASCVLCGGDYEDVKHIFIGCSFAFEVWNHIMNWCKLSPFFTYDFEDLLLLYKNVHCGKWRKKIVRGIVGITIWAIWKARNEKIFQDKNKLAREVLAKVKSMAFLWLQNRANFSCIVWEDWAKYPLYMYV